MDNQREKLIELLGLYLPINVRNQRGSYDTIGERTVPICDREILADHLLANGVIVPPCKVGTRVYRIVPDHLVTYPDPAEYTIIWDTFKLNDIYTFGKTVFLSREDAEKALEERKKK